MTITNGANMGVIESAAQGEEFYDEFKKLLRAADGFLMPFVLAQQNSPPGSPNDGDMYLVGTSGSGAWVGYSNAIARWWGAGSAWDFFTPRNGWEIKNINTGQRMYFNGGAWQGAAGSVLHISQHTTGLISSTLTGSATITGVDCVNNAVLVSVPSSSEAPYSISATTGGCTVTITNNYGISKDIPFSIIVLAS